MSWWRKLFGGPTNEASEQSKSSPATQATPKPSTDEARVSAPAQTLVGTQEESAKAMFIRTYRQADGNTYDIYRASSRSAALSFLRDLEVKEERRYAIVETPEGNVGKDFILIFEEKTGETVELGQRRMLAKASKAPGRCCCCGYPVLPYSKIPDFGPSIGRVRTYVILSEAKKNGAGFACSSCGAICCAFCGTPEKSPLCALCGNKMLPYNE